MSATVTDFRPYMRKLGRNRDDKLLLKSVLCGVRPVSQLQPARNIQPEQPKALTLHRTGRAHMGLFSGGFKRLNPWFSLSRIRLMRGDPLPQNMALARGLQLCHQPFQLLTDMERLRARKRGAKKPHECPQPPNCDAHLVHSLRKMSDHTRLMVKNLTKTGIAKRADG